MRQRRSAARFLAIAGLAWGVASLTGTPARAQEAGERRPPQISPLDLTGRDFGGLDVASSLERGGVSLSAARVWAWAETAPGRTTQRLLLEGDVKATVGIYSFTAARAAVWVEHLGFTAADEANPDGLPVNQIAVYFDRVSNPAAAPGFSHTADRLLVTGVLAGSVSVKLDTWSQRPAASPFLREAEARLARHLRKIAGFEEPEPRRPSRLDTRSVDVRSPLRPGVSQPFQPGSPYFPEQEDDAAAAFGPAIRTPPIFADEGIVTLAFGAGAEASLVPGEEFNAVVVTGGAIVQYEDPDPAKRLQLSARRVVLFLAPGSVRQFGRADAKDVLGVYLEGDVVATDGRYTLRGPRVYYDFQANRAAMVNAVFWQYDERRRLPLYVRADVIRQEASNQFSAENAKLSTTSFFEPSLSLGTSSVTITRVEQEGRPRQTLVDARGLTIRGLDFPIFYWPFFRGDIENIPIRDIRVVSRSGDIAIQTTWDLFGLIGRDPPEGVDSLLMLDGYFDRGAAVGSSTNWRTESASGELFGYLLPHDTGRDRLSSGAKIDRDGEVRGIVLGEHRWNLDEYWTVFLEAAYISDETFVDSFFNPLAETRREFANLAYARRTEGNSAFTGLLKGSLNDFTPNQYLLQSQGYTVDKLPEFAYYRMADDLLAAAAPGLLTWSSEYRYSRMRMNFVEPSLRDLGYNAPVRSMGAFGLGPDDSLAERLRDGGFTEDAVNRLDTRHELAATFDAGPFKITPFAVGRITFYDEQFEDFSPDEDDQTRIWGAAGVTTSTSAQRVYDGVSSSLLDVHRVRHIIEPSVTLWTAATTLEQEDLPVYDDEVESLADGAAVRLALDQTFQTKRGGPGRWRSVDFLTLDGELVLSDDDADDDESPIGRFFDYRPEYSLLGDFVSVRSTWQVSDPLAIAGQVVYDLDENETAFLTVGGILRHSEDLSTYAELRHINATDRTFVNFGANLRLTPTYTTSVRLSYDTDRKDFQSIGGTLTRRFQQATLGVEANWNNITEEFSLSMIFRPAGAPDHSVALRRLDQRSSESARYYGE